MRGKLISAACAALVTLTSGWAFASEQPVIYSGHIYTGDNAVAADGAYTMRFSALSATDSTTPMREIEVPVQVTAGAFFADVTGLIGDTADAAYMSIAVKGPQDSDFDTLGDVRLSAVPYAKHARHAATADVAASVDWTNVKNAPASLVGATGAQGPVGPAGAVGPLGPIGPVGPAGPQGVQGAVGLTGPQGEQGPQGIQGIAGSQGIAGAGTTILEESAGVNCSFGGLALIGADGSTHYACNGASAVGTLVATSEPVGASCPAGGIAVNDGFQTRYLCNGLQGLTGPAGPMGPRGLVGPQGLQGLVGPQGLQGLTGPIGLTGAQGLQGLVGPAGPQGLQGLTGAVGAIGPQGPIGLTGAQGLQGLVGATGAQGPIGLTGATGPQGIQGLTGPQGLQGLTGPQGAAGVIADSEQLLDSAGNVLGRVIGIDNFGVKVYNKKGYIYTVGWDGKLRGQDTYYTGLNCTGTAYMASSGATTTNYVKQLYRSTVNNNVLSLQAGTGDINLSKLAQTLSLIVSKENADGTCVASIGVMVGWPTTTVSAAVDTGVPATIVAPLVLPH